MMRIFPALLLFAAISTACNSADQLWKISSTTQAATAPAITAPQPLDIPVQDQIAYAPMRSISLSADPTNYLMLWPDLRTASFFPIWGTRINSAGAWQNATGFSATPPTSAESYVASAFNGTSHLVVWAADVGSNMGLLFSRLTPDAQVIETQAQPLQTGGKLGDRVRIASDGDGWLVVWDDQRAGTDHIYGGRITATGTLLDPEGFMISPTTAKAIHPTVAYGGGTYMVAWEDYRDQGTTDPDLYATRVFPDGTIADPTGLLISDDADVSEPSIEHDGNNFMIAWSTMGTIQASRVANDGTRMDVIDITLPNPSVLGTCDAPHVVFDGTQYLVGWTIREKEYQFCYAKRVSTSGAVLGGMTQKISESMVSPQPVNCAYASNGSNFLVAWSHYMHPNYPIHTRRISSAGAFLDSTPQAPSRSANFQNAPTGAYGNGTYLVAWEEYRHAEIADYLPTSVYATRLDNTASVLQSPAIKLPADHSSPIGDLIRSVAFDGDNFLVVWAQTETPEAIWGTRITPQGTILDASAFKIANDAGGTQMSPPTVAFAGGNYLVAWTDSSNPNSNLVGVRVSPNRTILDATPFAITSVAGVQSPPAIGASSDQFLVSWIDNRNGSNETFARRISSQGTLLGTGPINLGVAAASETQGGITFVIPPAVASDKSQYLVTWGAPSGKGYTVVARRLQLDGTLPAPSPKEIWTASWLAPDTVATFDGANFVVGWTEFGAATLPYGPHAVSMLAARLDPSGNLVTPIPVEIAAEDGNALASDLVSDEAGNVIALYSRFDSDPTVNTLRVYARAITWPTVGQACTSAADCPNFGNCVDGVCCHTACGNGDTTDCQACSVAAGAQEDGHCSPLIAGAVCRAQNSMCDLPEKCNGTSTVCAADTLKPDGATCTDGDACTQTDTCLAGACVGSNPVSCAAAECTLTGDCDKLTGECTKITAGTECDDSDGCTVGDSCQQGVCESGTPLDCVPGECAFSSVCNSSSGLWDTVNLVDGTPCSLGVCKNGVCESGTPFDAGVEPDLFIKPDATPLDTVAPPPVDTGVVIDAAPTSPPPLPEGCSCRIDTRSGGSRGALGGGFFLLCLYWLQRRRR
jgi:hypothetical protein